jgi:hypothetical protein
MNSQSQLNSSLENLSNLELAKLLAQKVSISSHDWHKLKNNRQAQAAQQLASGLVYLLNGETEEALQRINQAQGWLDHTINPLPCPSHGQKKNS